MRVYLLAISETNHHIWVELIAFDEDYSDWLFIKYANDDMTDMMQWHDVIEVSCHID